jgi:dienelactone hydrolase
MEARTDQQPDATPAAPVPAWARRAEVRPSGWQRGEAARPRVAVVGPCASGKTTLVAALHERGYDAHAVAQEHSGVPYLWQLREPDVLIFLNVTIDATAERRDARWPPDLYATQQARLANARQHADLYLDTSPISAAEVAARASDFLATCLASPDEDGG